LQLLKCQQGLKLSRETSDPLKNSFSWCENSPLLRARVWVGGHTHTHTHAHTRTHAHTHTPTRTHTHIKHSRSHTDHPPTHPPTHPPLPVSPRTGSSQGTRTRCSLHTELQLPLVLRVPFISSAVLHRVVWQTLRGLLLPGVSRWLSLLAVSSLLPYVHVSDTLLILD
jgi:hypothetical protein